ncbi:MAG: outer membrane protein assembly factor BamA [Buchnera aphidicola (Periphyllus lyropictus)]|uniref:outer membrane protein assembly factor BamA n=1 Tax=Buchnera aphidicola TaxID=9 RepID=UPI001EB41582|nr:outer membrane protein assembly factor BamA [Buchnera aphidicola]NIH16636.1 outer membrane protein assembly factor BamA [Buchnera aphidicola (Periphyllus lyropictus)]USS94546.1 outer membrane protein assembly factor BamA [Buchnera aphidicola (Periphyllus lyropictus)]
MYNQIRLRNLFFIFLLIFNTDFSYACDNFLFKNIEIQGLHNVSKKEALSCLTFSENEYCSKQDIQDSIKNFYSNKKFKKVQVSRSDDKITFLLEEFPILSKLRFYGNRFIDDNSIKEILQASNIYENSFFDEKNIAVFKDKIFEYYSNVLKNNVKIIFKKNIKKNNLEQLEIIIHENKSTKIDNLYIVGNKKFSSKEIFSLFNFNKKTSLLDNFMEKKYDIKDLQEDLKTLYHFYNTQGYINFDIIDTNLNYFHHKKHVDVILKIYEGNKYTISDVSLKDKNFTLLKDFDFSSYVKFNSVYNIDHLIKLNNKIQKILSKNGYFNSEIIFEPVIDQELKTIKFLIDITKKDQFVIDNIFFKGNKKITKNFFIDKFLQKENKILNNFFVNKDLKFLKKTNFFNNINIEFVPTVRNNVHYFDMIYHVKERKDHTFHFGAGFTHNNQVKYNLIFNKNHFLKVGNNLSINFSKSLDEFFFKIIYKNPFFTNSNTLLKESLFLNIKNHDNDFKNNIKNNFLKNFCERTYNIFNSAFNFNKYFSDNKSIRYGIEGSCEFPFLKYGFFSSSLGFLNDKYISKKENFINRISDFIENFGTKNNSIISGKTIRNLYINNFLSFKKLDNHIFPNKGTNVNISMNSVFPIKQKNYLKFSFDVKKYYPIIKIDSMLSVMFHSYLGCMFLNGNKLNELNVDNFHFNKNCFVRGFNAENVSKILPNNFLNFMSSSVDNKKNVDDNKSKNLNKNNLSKGNLISVTNIDLISKIPYGRHNFLKNFRVSSFFDFGNVWKNNFLSTNIENFSMLKNLKFYCSSGVSLLWHSPFGMISFSYSSPSGSHMNDSTQTFQVNFGN